MKKNLMIRYVFEANPNALKKIISKYGMAPAVSPQDLWKKINYIVMKFPQDALKDIVSVHPDREIILHMATPSQHITAERPITKEAIENIQNAPVPAVAIAEKKTSGCGGQTSGCEGSSGCSGCGGSCGSKKSGADGDKTPAPATDAKTITPVVHEETKKSSFKEHLPLVAVSIVAISGLLYLLNKRA